MMTRRRKKSVGQTPSLPDDLLISVFARISKLYYPSLSLVSKRFRSLLTSPELYKTRSLLGHTEKCLYVCIKFPHDENPRWFTLCKKPTINNNNNKKKKKSSGYVLATIPNPNSPHSHYARVVSVGSSIYTIGGPINGSPSAKICVLDCQTHTWSEAPSMSVEREYPKANVVDGKIYVAGGLKESSSSDWIEVFDTETRVWENVLSSQGNGCIFRSAVIGGSVLHYMLDDEVGLVYIPREGKWETTGWANFFRIGSSWSSHCVVDKVLYCNIDGHGLKWYDFKINLWRKLEGLKGLPKFASYACVKLADYGGKLVVFWTKYFPASGYKEKRIWCAVIELQRREGGQMWGDVEWFEPVLTVPNSFHFVGSPLAATV